MVAVDHIYLSGLIFFGRHGVNPAETALGQRFGVDLDLSLDLSAASRSDDLEDTVSYAALYKIVRAEIEGKPSKLLEHLCGRVLRAVLMSDKRLVEVEVRITKLNPPIKGSETGSAAVSMRRSRQDL